MLRKIITIEGMHCAHCASTIEKAIASIQGVKSAKVVLDKKACIAKINSEISDDVIIKAVTDAGFEFVELKTKKSLF